MALSNRFRNASGTRYTKALFFELTGADKTSVVYTLKDQDHNGYPSLYRLYMETGDPTEYLFATKHLDGWEHWTMMMDTDWLKPFVDRWRIELELKTRAEALARIKAEAKSTSKNAFTANKLLLDGGWKSSEEKRQVGRPSQKDVREAAEALAHASLTDPLSDYERLRTGLPKAN